jgi:hypothetical protein
MLWPKSAAGKEINRRPIKKACLRFTEFFLSSADLFKERTASLDQRRPTLVIIDFKIINERSFIKRVLGCQGFFRYEFARPA